MARIDERAEYRVTIQAGAGPEAASALGGDSGPVEIAQFEVDECRGTTTLAGIVTDQGGLVGLIRHLHSLGIVLLRVERLAGSPDAAGTLAGTQLIDGES